VPSHNAAPPPRAGDSRGPEHGQTYRRSLVAGVRLRTMTLLQFYEQFHAVSKYVNTVICNNIAVTYVKSREISQ